MVDFSRGDDLSAARFDGTNLRGARFVGADLSGVVMRGVQVENLDIDAPWLPDGDHLLINGVDVIGFVEGELNRRFPGREQRRADTPEGLRAAWLVLQDAWSAAVQRAADLSPAAVEASVDGEWTFAQTLRHLVLATDTWLGRGVLELEQPFHPIGQAMPNADEDGLDLSLFMTERPTYDEVLRVRAERVAMVTDFLADVTAADLAVERRNPWAPQYPETTLSCLHVILEEEWEHLRYALRDLDAIANATNDEGSADE